ncbi:hypothetical protein FGIG_02316 [Fasciola gigantica]|uniref:Uncharacterized protein n=1 Tax=Fasciola gigantica TaxID=46835 RepID=A0A504YTF5_FASGI|nr:hypothetical protein FGIG_02316 [Fasciola gigantica]
MGNKILEEGTAYDQAKALSLAHQQSPMFAQSKPPIYIAATTDSLSARSQISDKQAEAILAASRMSCLLSIFVPNVPRKIQSASRVANGYTFKSSAGLLRTQSIPRPSRHFLLPPSSYL